MNGPFLMDRDISRLPCYFRRRERTISPPGRARSVTTGTGLFKEILVAPSARFERLEEVMVVRVGPEDQRMTQSLRPEPSPRPR